MPLRFRHLAFDIDSEPGLAPQGRRYTRNDSHLKALGMAIPDPKAGTSAISQSVAGDSLEKLQLFRKKQPTGKGFLPCARPFRHLTDRSSGSHRRNISSRSLAVNLTSLWLLTSFSFCVESLVCKLSLTDEGEGNNLLKLNI